MIESPDIDAADEIRDLVHTLHATQQRLQQLTGGEVDAIILPGGTSYLLHDAQEKLRVSEERFREISARLAKVLDSSLDAVCSFDRHGRFLQVSAASEKLWGYRPEELLGTAYIDKVLPEDRPMTIAAANEIMAGKPTTRFENRYVRKDGSITHIMWSAWWSEEDESMFSVARDNTEARRAEAGARALTERLALATRASKVGIWDWDILSDAMHWDEEMYRLYGADSSSSQGVDIWNHNLHPEDRSRANAELQAAMRSDDTPFDTSFRILVPPDGTIRHIRAQGVVFRDQLGRPCRMLGTNWDVTADVLREETLREKLANERVLLKKALAGEKAKSEFLAVMSHEIRTPISGVLGFAEMLAHSPSLSAEEYDLSQAILSNGGALLRILDDILEFSSLGAGHLSIEKKPFSPLTLVREIEVLFRHQIHEKGLEFLVVPDGALPATVVADGGRIRQILINLIGNALKFTDCGSIRLETRSSLGTASDGVLEFSIRDTGSGISPEMAEMVFDPFVQGDSSISRSHGGTGLGLAISRKLAVLMGGELSLLPQGEGSHFHLRIPITRGHDASPDPAQRSPEGGTDPGFARLHPLRILIVDDDKINLRLISNILRKLGYDPASARDGSDAVALYVGVPFDCILMDLQMPVMDGIETTRRIRAHEAACGQSPAFISALTANIMVEHHDDCLAAGMNACLNKPINIPKLKAKLVEAHAFRLVRAAA